MRRGCTAMTYGVYGRERRRWGIVRVGGKARTFNCPAGAKRMTSRDTADFLPLPLFLLFPRAILVRLLSCLLLLLCISPAFASVCITGRALATFLSCRFIYGAGPECDARRRKSQRESRESAWTRYKVYAFTRVTTFQKDL